jgi:hypothetical protein
MKQPSFFNQILQYLFIKKKDANAPNAMDIKFMHGMNRISIFMFIFAMIVLIYRLFFKR